MQNKIDITSTAVEKGIDLAKDFLDKLIMPAVEETGLLIKDKVTIWKFKNQVKTLTKAKKVCDENGISPKTISLKLLCPLLDNAALEEDEILQDKWAVLLSNLVDSDQNIENHVFPYILGQISTNEFLFLEQVYFSKKERLDKLRFELEEFKRERPGIENKLKEEINKFDDEIKKLQPETEKAQTFPFNREVWDLQDKKRKAESRLGGLKYRESRISLQMTDPEVIPEDVLKEFEISNLIRLGLIKAVQESIANSQTLEIPKNADDHWNEYISVDLDIDIESNIEHVLTELGELFIEACTEKKKRGNKTAPNNE